MSRPKITEARPRGPNHPMKRVAERPKPAPSMLNATGTMRTTVRLSSAYGASASRKSPALLTATQPSRLRALGQTLAPLDATSHGLVKTLWLSLDEELVGTEHKVLGFDFATQRLAAIPLLVTEAQPLQLTQAGASTWILLASATSARSGAYDASGVLPGMLRFKDTS